MKRLLVLLMFAATVCAQKDPTSRSWNQPVKPFRIVGNVYYVGATDITSYLITTPKGHFLLDGGFEETAPMIRANIEKLGFKVSDVQYILTSHQPSDRAAAPGDHTRTTRPMSARAEGHAAPPAGGGKADRNSGAPSLSPPIIAD